MMRINGIGTTWLGATGRDAENRLHATLWFTVAWAPVLPIRRCRLQLLPHKGSGFAYRELERTPLVAREIFHAYLWSYLVVPLLLVGPMVPAFEEIRVALGMPTWLQTTIIAVGVVWICVFVWKLADWHEARYHV